MLKTFDIKDLKPDMERPFIERDISTIVDPVYVSRDKQIASFIRSGQLLRASRSSYEYPDGNVPDDVQPDPTSKIGFDLADASAIQKQLEKKQAEAASVAKQQQARAASTDAEVNESDQKDN